MFAKTQLLASGRAVVQTINDLRSLRTSKSSNSLSADNPVTGHVKENIEIVD